MSRPAYESEQDRGNEDRIIDLVCKKWKAKAEKLPKRYIVDYGLYRDGELKAWAEIKCRNVPRSQYPTFFISLEKWLKGRELAIRTNVPFLLIVEWTDGLRYLDARQYPQPPIKSGGRDDRDDWQDIEPMVHLQHEWFKVLVND